MKVDMDNRRITKHKVTSSFFFSYFLSSRWVIGGTTYCALATLALAPPQYNAQLTGASRGQTISWLNQRQVGGFQGRTEKVPDVCYSFWCGASLYVSSTFIEATALTWQLGFT